MELKFHHIEVSASCWFHFNI